MPTAKRIYSLLNHINIFAPPPGLTPTQRKNFFYTQMDALGVGLVNGAAPFLAVFLTRLGGTNFQVGLLSAMPGFTGLFLGLFIGRFLQTRSNIVPWYSRVRLLVFSAYTLTGLIALFVPQKAAITAMLVIWGLASVPQAVLNVAFSVVMNAIAGPEGRYTLMSRRWSVLGLTAAIMTIIAGQLLNWIDFPQNYAVVFILFSLGGLVSFRFSSRMEVPPLNVEAVGDKTPLFQQLKRDMRLVFSERPFIAISIKRLIYIFGSNLVMPLFTLYYVRIVGVNDAWISFITTAQNGILLLGYSLWTQQHRKRGARFILLSTTLALALYPALTAITRSPWLLVIYAGIAAIFQAGLNLVFFDELMKTVPPQYSATFISVDQSAQNALAMSAPLISTSLSTFIGIPGALWVGAAVRFIAFGMFLRDRKKPDEK
ncbi:MAG TPA: MFS transporter [Anaerolineae bacterium]|nr:MFS transporter [Anaerolineae bacterium]HQH36983.1 MFS transporter [Anaerolineae bacterium]